VHVGGFDVLEGEVEKVASKPIVGLLECKKGFRKNNTREAVLQAPSTRIITSSECDKKSEKRRKRQW